jgi:hypothetical protein
MDSRIHTVLIKPITYAIPFRPLKKFLRRWPEQGDHMREVIDIVLFILWTSSGAEQISVLKQVPDLQYSYQC